MAHRFRNLLIGALLVIAGIAGGFILTNNLNLQSVLHAQESAVAPHSTLPESPFVSVANKVVPAVVSIEVKRRVTTGDDSGAYGDLFHRFFPDAPGNGSGQRRRSAEIPASGSGFLIDREGHILTNNHVVSGSTDITVRLSDHRTFKARLLGHDPFTDIAMIKIEGSDLPVADLGNSDDMRVGDWAIAIGNPLGELEGSLTVGVISAKGRAGLNIGNEPGEGPGYQDFLQTDASINFGNSGGPLCNIKGQVIGINTAINPAGQGIGFAIPINIAGKLKEKLALGGPIAHGFLGILPQEITPELAEGKGLKSTNGVLVNSVTPNTSATDAGIRQGDVITEFNSEKITSLGQFRRVVADAPVGQRVPLVLVRDGNQKDVSVVLRARPEDKVAAAPEVTGSKDWLGLKVDDISAATPKGAKGRRPARGTDEAAPNGVVVTDVDEGSPAEEAGIQEGDIIQEVNGSSVASTADYGAAIKKLKGTRKPVVVLVNHQGFTQYVAVKPKS